MGATFIYMKLNYSSKGKVSVIVQLLVLEQTQLTKYWVEFEAVCEPWLVID